MTDTSPPASDDLRLIAGELIKINQHLSLITGWMEGQENITKSHTLRMLGIEGKMQLLYDVARPYGTKIDAMAICLETIARTLRGVTELAKSTFDMVTESKGGDNAGTSSERPRQAAAAGP